MRFALASVVSLLGLPAAAFGDNRTAHDAAPYAPLTTDGVPVPQARGVWQSRGYGWILEARDDGLSVYHISAAACSRDPRRLEFIQHFAYHRLDEAARQLIVVQYPGENRYVFDRLPALPPACTRTDWTPTRAFEHFAASYREQYAFFAERHVDWEARVSAHRALVTDGTSPRVLFAIFSDMLDQLGDAHVGLNATFDGEPVVFRTGRGPTLDRLNERAVQTRASSADLRSHWRAAYDRGVREIVLRGAWQEASQGRLVWGRIGEDIGYINLSAVEGFVEGSLEQNIEFVNERMNRILAELEGVKAIIIDATVNSGGYDRLAREIAGHFAAERTPAYTKRAYGAQGTTPDSFHAQPSSARRFLGPTYLLTSDFTVSGGEILTLTLRVLPNVTQVGTRTRGALSDRLVKVMPDGSDFSISNEIYLDPQGEVFEAIGIPPHRPLEIFPPGDLEGGHAKAVAALVRQIRDGSATRSPSMK